VPAAQVIDADGHVFEPDELWEEHLDPAFLDRRPRIARDEHGTTRYDFEGRLIPPGYGRGAWVPEGIVEASLKRDGGVDPKARLVDMDEEGIDVAVIFGTSIALTVNGLQDQGLAGALAHGVNRWLVEEYLVPA